MELDRTSKALFRRLAIRFMLFVLLIIFVFYGLPTLIRLFYPFIFVFIVAVIVNPLVRNINDKTSKLKINSKSSSTFLAFVIFVLLLAFISLFTYIVFAILIREIIGLATNIQVNWPSIVRAFEEMQDWIAVQIGVLPNQTVELLNHFTESILAFIQNLSGNLLNVTVVTTSLFISVTGTLFLNLLTFFLALYFMISDYQPIKQLIKKRMNQRTLNTVRLLKSSTVSGVGGYIKTQLILAFIAFMFMLIAFTIYGQEYALILALILALIDLIPLIGTIAMLLPWGMLEWFVGDPNKGLFLLILGIAFFLFRRVIEPKIMGTQTGLHPLLALIGIYVGIEISGLWGALLGPLTMVILISVLQTGILENTFSDIKDLYNRILFSLQK
ncbi:AI-2E family transporter [Pisciglobus halotolerans]|uniref:Sporulation integral membrane protein YtvI n=1 Tax=Pisciglobus halotolerans TaxID=745365 RepID=A0A1I3B390_9LACT|nr:AI-2E family transporter [Pisciglobus halotolerans]SFH56409.1 sporulation integral membrane protein YtvI [Pisciglobus halotolerans]